MIPSERFRYTAFAASGERYHSASSLAGRNGSLWYGSARARHFRLSGVCHLSIGSAERHDTGTAHGSRQSQPGNHETVVARRQLTMAMLRSQEAEHSLPPDLT